MRSALVSCFEQVGVPDHVALAYDAWAPVSPADGKVPDDERQGWLAKLADIAVFPDYRRSYERWKKSFRAPGDRVFELTLASRLLVGMGNSSATDVGLTVHHTWGVPVIPGTSLKGLLAHYVDAVYGPDEPDRPPWESSAEKQERARYQGVIWHGRRIYCGPGEIYRHLFGAPDADLDEHMRTHGLDAGASRGLVVFHDALYVPSSAPDDKPYVPDVVTVHQKSYYDCQGRNFPNDYENPNPISFLTVRPGTRFLFAVSGPTDWTKVAEHLLVEALREWGIGGKTSSGYGRFLPQSDVSVVRTRPRSVGSSAIPKSGDRVEVVLLEERTKKGGWLALHEGSQLAGPIQNSADVPAEAKPGDKVEVVVAYATPRDIAFRYPKDDLDRSSQQPKKKGGDRR